MLRLIPNAFDPRLVREAARAWPAPDWPGWFKYENGKHVCSDWAAMPGPCAMLLNHLLAFSPLELPGVVPDGSLWGGGLHSMGPGPGLGLHLDSDHNPRHGWRRLMNAVLFLNETWFPDCGGDFELWDEDRRWPIARITPVFNSLLIFAPGDDAPHAVAPVTCPEGVQRKSLAVFWVGPAACRRPRAEFAKSPVAAFAKNAGERG